MRGLTLPVRVYLEDTDAQGLVYNATYFRFMERARTEWLRDRGIDHVTLKEQENLSLVLSAIELRFTAPARLNDMLYVYAGVTEFRGARVQFEQTIRRSVPDGALVCRGTAEVACMDSGSGRPRRLPAILTDELKA